LQATLIFLSLLIGQFKRIIKDVAHPHEIGNLPPLHESLSFTPLFLNLNYTLKSTSPGMPPFLQLQPSFECLFHHPVTAGLSNFLTTDLSIAPYPQSMYSFSHHQLSKMCTRQLPLCCLEVLENYISV